MIQNSPAGSHLDRPRRRRRQGCPAYAAAWAPPAVLWGTRVRTETETVAQTTELKAVGLSQSASVQAAMSCATRRSGERAYEKNPPALIDLHWLLGPSASGLALGSRVEATRISERGSPESMAVRQPPSALVGRWLRPAQPRVPAGTQAGAAISAAASAFNRRVLIPGGADGRP